MGIDTHHCVLESLLIRFIHLILPRTLPDRTGHYFIIGVKFQNGPAPVYIIDSVTLSSFKFLYEKRINS